METNLNQKLTASGKPPGASEKMVGAIRGARMRRSKTLIDVESAGETFMPARRVWERYGIHETTLGRWLKDEAMGFPTPLYIGRFRYWRLSDLVAFERREAA